jgi:hypothetical protein
MLRQRLSSSALRVRSLSQPAVIAAHPAVPTIPIAFASSPASRGLASAVLLSSRENWQAQNVKGLKEALQKRGLPV